MARYADDAREKVRDAVDFAELVGSRTDLRRTSGTSYMGLCPFHDERTPSFSVDASKKMFHCFGCGEEGDLFDFVERIEGLDFVGALEWLADHAGIELEVADEDPQAAERRRRRERLLELVERVTSFYERYLWESREAGRARAYLAQRGLTEETLRAFRVGYAPSAWDTVLMSSQKSGFKPRELYEAGLLARTKGKGRVYDYFRARIMFPLADGRGRVLGFGGRALRERQQPKYLNTSEKRELFHKGSIVYGAHLARAAAAKANAVIVCEGYTDVLALRQAGVDNVVASMGTALTGEQVGALARLAGTVHLALDADDAGQDAMLRAARVAAGQKLELRVVPLPRGRDPAEVALAEGADAVRALVERSVPFVRFQVERTLALADLSSADGKDRAIEALRPAFASVGPSVLRESLLELVADRLDVRVELARELLEAPGGGGGGAGSGEVARAPAPEYEGFADPEDEWDDDAAWLGSDPAPRVVSRSAESERAFLALCCRLPAEGVAALAELALDEHFTDPAARAAAVWLREHAAAPLEGVDDDALGRTLAEILHVAEGLGEVRPPSLEVERLRLELRLLERRMASPGAAARADLARRRSELRAEIDRAMERSLA